MADNQPLPRWALDEAKDLIKAQVAKHAHGGVRLLNEIIELADNNAHVVSTATALVEKSETQ